MQDRQTRIGKITQGDGACDIIFHENDCHCLDQQALIKHDSDGYYLVDTGLNGHTKI